MNTSMIDLETMQTTAVFDENGFLHATQPLPGKGGETVQIVVIRVKEIEYDDSDLTPQQWERGVSTLMAANFADDPEENIYSREDGKAFDATQY